VLDCGQGRVALRSAGGLISVSAPASSAQVVLRAGEPAEAETFQWTETAYGELMLLSIATHRHLRIDPHAGTISADRPGPAPDRSDGSCFMARSAEN
jgi:hypothetical protein